MQNPLQIVWFSFIVAAGFVLCFALPPFRGNDEFEHAIRVANTARGDLVCTQHSNSLNSIYYRLYDGSEEHRTPRFSPEQLTSASAQSRLSGKERVESFVTGCHYWPVAYLPMAFGWGTTFAITEDPLIAHYASRVASWMAMTALILWVLLFMPWARNFVLAFFSIPQVVQQTTAINTELILFALCFLLISSFIGRPDVRSVIKLSCITGALAVTKIVFFPLMLFLIPHLWSLKDEHALSPKRFALLAGGAFAGPILIWRGWHTLAPLEKWAWAPPWGVNPSEQKMFLLEHPFHLFALVGAQVADFFGNDPMRGSILSVLGVFGNSKVLMPGVGYIAVGVALVGALFLDLSRSRDPLPSDDGPRMAVKMTPVMWVLALGAILSTFLATMLAMYLYFTAVGADSTLGVQGRYYLPPFLLLTLLGIRMFAGRRLSPLRRSKRHVLLTLTACCSVFGVLCTLWTVTAHYWLP